MHFKQRLMYFSISHCHKAAERISGAAPLGDGVGAVDDGPGGEALRRRVDGDPVAVAEAALGVEVLPPLADGEDLVRRRAAELGRAEVQDLLLLAELGHEDAELVLRGVVADLREPRLLRRAVEAWAAKG